MATQYHIYKNTTDGGAIDYAAPIGTTAALTFATAALAFPFTHWFGVRAYDTLTGWEDLNTDARVRLILDSSGVNVTGRPAAPTGLSAVATANGGIGVEWSFLPVPGATAPTGFKVWCQEPGPINYALAASATATYDAGRVAFSVDLAGLTNGVTYTVAVRSTNATGDSANTDSATVVADATGPLPVADLSGTPTY